MNKEQIETIIENLAKSGYKFQSEKTEDGSIRVRISDNSQILFSFKADSLNCSDEDKLQLMKVMTGQL